MDKTTDRGITRSHKPPPSTAISELLERLLNRQGLGKGSSEEKGHESQTPPPLDIAKLLLALAQETEHCIQVPQNSIQAHAPPNYAPLTQITKPNLTTAELAYYLNRQPQTLRVWACHEDGPIRPLRVNGRLAWPTEQAKALLGVA